MPRRLTLAPATLARHVAHTPVALASCSEHDLDMCNLDMLDLDLETLAHVLQTMLQTTRRIELLSLIHI